MAELAKVLISKTTLASDQPTVSFSSISSAYTSLHLVFSIRSTNTTAMKANASTNAAMRILFNNNLTSNTNCGSYYFKSYSADVYTNYTFPTRPTLFNSYYCIIGDVLTDGDAANMFTAGQIFINNYSKTNQTKIYMGQLAGFGTSEGCITRGTGSYSSQSAISQIDISMMSGSVKAGSSFSLYGILTA